MVAGPSELCDGERIGPRVGLENAASNRIVRSHAGMRVHAGVRCAALGGCPPCQLSPARCYLCYGTATRRAPARVPSVTGGVSCHACTELYPCTVNLSTAAHAFRHRSVARPTRCPVLGMSCVCALRNAMHCAVGRTSPAPAMRCRRSCHRLSPACSMAVVSHLRGVPLPHLL
jgi:hypothetical protein